MRLLAKLMGYRDPDAAKTMINTYTGVIAGLRKTYAESMAEGEFEKTADAEENLARAVARIVHLEEGQTAVALIQSISDWKIVASLIVAFAIVLAVALALGGGIFAAVPGQGPAANGGVYVVNKFTGDVYWCLPGGPCRASR